MTELLHVSFATPNFSQSAQTLRRSARRFGVSDVAIYGPRDAAVKRMLAENPWVSLETRGAGYWLWKPYILLDAMEHVPEGTPILYTDVAVYHLAAPGPLLKLAGDADIVLFSHDCPDWTQAVFTKRDCFVLLDADTPRDWERLQLDAAFQLYRAGPHARAFLEEMKDAMRDPRVISDQANMCGKPDLPGFRDHRHDQSVLTILAARHGIEPFRSPYARRTPGDARSDYPQIFHHHRRQNVNLLRRTRRRLKDAMRMMIFGQP